MHCCPVLLPVGTMKVNTEPPLVVNVIGYAEISQGLHPWLAPFLMRWRVSTLSQRYNPDERRGGLGNKPTRQRAEFTQGVTR